MTIQKAMRKPLALLLALSMLFALAACGSQGGSSNAADDIVNGDFEEVADGQWVGWTRKDAAFNFRGVVSDEKINNVTMEKSGSYYFAGTKGGNPPMRGTLTSDVFKLGGNDFSYHLDGWNNGIGEGDAWAVQSSNFTLAGSGFISVRMGGAAAAVTPTARICCCT